MGLIISSLWSVILKSGEITYLVRKYYQARPDEAGVERGDSPEFSWGLEAE